MRISDLDYHLPPANIAVCPAQPRDHSRLMIVRAHGSRVDHCRFYDLPAFLATGDLLVSNNTRVLPAKLSLTRQTGARIDGLFLADRGDRTWDVLLRTRGKVRDGETLLAVSHADPTQPPCRFLLAQRLGKGMWRVRLHCETSLNTADILARIGTMPIPPYIEKARREQIRAASLPAINPAPPTTAGRPVRADADTESDPDWYQTIFAQSVGRSVAAPTAGLHFTPTLLQVLAARGVRHASVELEVGMGTFLPVETETLEEHIMHRELFRIPAATVAAIREARARQSSPAAAGAVSAGSASAGHRLVLVGTTAVRTLESAAAQILSDSPPAEIAGETSLKISPGYNLQLTDLLITNFHLPRSTLMALVGARIGIERLKELYALAIEKNYRFYSYGDAMLILPE